MKQYLHKNGHRLTEAERAEIWDHIDPARARRGARAGRRPDGWKARRPAWRWRLAPGWAVAGAACAVLAVALLVVLRGRGPLPESTSLPADEQLAAAPTAPDKGVTVAPPGDRREPAASAPETAPETARPEERAARVSATAPVAESRPVTTGAHAAPALAAGPAGDGGEAGRESTRGTLRGSVVDRESGQPLPLAEIVALGGAAGAVTADDGRFVLAGLAPGQPTPLRVEYLGFAPVETTVTLAAGDTLALDFALTPVIVAALEPFEIEGAKYMVEVKNAVAPQSEQRDWGTMHALRGAPETAAPPASSPAPSAAARSQERITRYAVDSADHSATLSAKRGTERSTDRARDASAAPDAARAGRPGEARFEIPPDVAARIADEDEQDDAAWRRRCWVPPGDRSFDAMTFRHSGVNPFVLTDRDPLATFALDVDNASYTIAREYLEQGALPPAGAVRVEEFVNYFDQGYPEVRDGDFLIHVDGAPSPFGRGHHLLRVGVRARDVREGPRRPANLVFVIDVSGSMAQEGRLETVKQALRLLLDELGPRDTVGIVAFTTDARVVLEPTGAARRRAIEAAIAELEPEQSTNVDAGLELGYRMARAHFRPGGVNRIVLCSDGVANQARTRAEEILDHVRRESDGGIQLSAVGVGMGNYNDVLLEQLADHGDGNYYYVDRPEEARRIFRENLTGTLRTVAEDARIQVEFDPARVSRWRLLGYENRRLADRDFRDDNVDAGEVGAGHQVTALFEVKLAGRDGRDDGHAWDDDTREAEFRRRGGRDGALATVRLRYRQPGAAGERESGSWRRGRGEVEGDWQEVQRRVTAGDLSRTFAAAAPRLRLDAVVAEFAEILRGSYWARDSRLADLVRPAREVARALPGDGRVRELAQLVHLAARLDAGPGEHGAEWDDQGSDWDDE